MKLERRVKGTGNVTTLIDGSLYRLRYPIPGEEKPRSERVRVSSYSAAEKILRSRIKAIDERELGPEVSFNRLFDLVITDHELHSRADTRELKNKINKHLRPKFGALDVYKAMPDLFNKYKIERRDAGASDATINRALAVIKRGLRLAREQQICNVSIPIKLFKENNARQGFVERDVYLAYRDELPESHRPLWIFAYHTGIRKGELLKLLWEWTRVEDGMIKIPGTATKNGRPRTIPIYGEMREAVEYLESVRNPDCPYLFQDGGELLIWRRTFENARKSLGVPVLFHDLRRTAVRNMERAGIPRTEAMQISGHLTEATYKRYDIASEKGALLAGQRMERFHAEEAQTRPIVSRIVPIRKPAQVISISKAKKIQEVS